jgi:beta-glucanase (GH16 family)
LSYENYAGAWLPSSTQGAQVNGSTPGVTVYGPNVDTTWGVTGQGDTLVGGTADNYYWLPNGDTLIEQQPGGTNTVEIWQGYTLPTNVQNLIVFGTNQYAAGNSANNVIQVTGAGDTIYGGTGEDVFIGSGGSGTTFIVAQGEGDKVIENFTEGADTLRLIGGSLNSFAEVQAAMTQQGSDVVLNDGGTMVLFRNATVGEFQAKDFQLPLAYSSLGAMTFDDEFNSAATIGTTWTTSIGPVGDLNAYTLVNNGEQEIYTSPSFTGTGATPLGLNPFSVSNGVLTISATPVTAAQSAAMWGYKYSSGLLESNFTQTYGYFEVRAELPKGDGLWPAFWLIGNDQNEIDVLEGLGSNTSVAYNAVHALSIEPGYSHASYNPYASGFHTYGVLWTAQTISYYVDGAEVWQTATPSDMNSPMHMIVNLAVGGNWPGSPDATTTWPAQMEVDYVRAYALGAAPVTTSGGGSTTTTTASTGSASTSSTTTTSANETLTSTTIGAILTGGAGYTTFYPSQGNDVLTGGTGGNDYIFSKEPWSPDTITNFHVGTDKLDLSALFASIGYTGSSPVQAGYIFLASDGEGGTIVRFDQDPAGPNQPYPTTIIDLKNISPTGLTWAELTNPSSATTSSSSSTTSTTTNANETLTATKIGSVLTGGAGYTTFYPSQGNDVLTGGTGGNDYIFSNEPWSPDTITNFKVGTDKLDLSALFASIGYTGSNPVQDGYIFLLSDGNGGTIVRFDHDAAGPSQPYPNTIIDLQGVSPTGLTWAELTNPAANASGSTTTTASSSPTPSAETLTATAIGAILTGGAGYTTFYPSQGNDVLTGGTGGNDYVFTQEPWSPDTIANFHLGTDKLDLSALFASIGYTGSNPVADGYIYLLSDGNGGTIVRFDHSPAGPEQPYPNTIIDLQHLSPTGLTWAELTQLTAASSSATASATAPEVLQSQGIGSVLTGGPGNNTIYASQGEDVLTGGGGDNTYVFTQEPWAPDTITNFNPAKDRIDLTALFNAIGYTGTNPLLDGHLFLETDGSGGTIVRFDHYAAGPSQPYPNTIIDLLHIAPSQLSVSDFLI